MSHEMEGYNAFQGDRPPGEFDLNADLARPAILESHKFLREITQINAPILSGHLEQIIGKGPRIKQIDADSDNVSFKLEGENGSGVRFPNSQVIASHESSIRKALENDEIYFPESMIRRLAISRIVSRSLSTTIPLAYYKGINSLNTFDKRMVVPANDLFRESLLRETELSGESFFLGMSNLHLRNILVEMGLTDLDKASLFSDVTLPESDYIEWVDKRNLQFPFPEPLCADEIIHVFDDAQYYLSLQEQLK